MAAQGSQAALEAAADGVKLPLAVVTVQLAHHNGCLDGEVLPQVIADQVGPRHHILDVDIGIGDLAEILAAGFGVVNGHGKGNALHIGRNQGHVHHDLLVVAVALAGQIVPHVLDGAAGMLQVAVEDKLLFCGALAAAAHHKGGGVQVKGRTGIVGVYVPAQAHNDLGQARVSLGQVYLLSLCQIDCHACFLRFSHYLSSNSLLCFFG